MPPPPPRSGHGCLWGCLIAAVIAIAAIVGAISYGGWWLYSGFKNDPTLQTVITSVNGDQIARSVLGDNIEITNLESSNFSSDLTTGKHASYVARVRGNRGEGTLAVTVDTISGRSRITSMVLTGPDGRTYDLTTSQPMAPPGSI
ncbi:MAG: cytochrome c oxidase assembly factor Coa1 family protein [Rhizomicrobium sp.]